MSLVHAKTLAGFEHKKMARRCLLELRRGQVWRPDMKIVVQSKAKGHEELPLRFTHARGAMLQGMLLGSIAGLIAGVLISVFEARAGGIAPVFIAAFFVSGMIMGGFAGAIVGPMNPGPALDELERHGDVVVLVESPDAKDIDWANRVFHKWGARAAPAMITPASLLHPLRSPGHSSHPGTTVRPGRAA